MAQSTKHFRKRDAILAYLRSTNTHPSAEMVYAKLKPEIPDLSLGTVYRNLALFKQQGMISSLGSVNNVERFDGNTDPHVHFICTSCDDVADLHTIEIPNPLTNTAEETTGGTVSTCQLIFNGICKNCLTARKDGQPA